MIAIEPLETDARQFIDLLVSTIYQELSARGAQECYLVRVDHAFDFKWLGFSGNMGAQQPVWKRKLTIPAFHPHRIVSQQHFVCDPSTGAYESDGRGRELHIEAHAGAKLGRRIADFSDSALFVWYSGATAKSDRGSIMMYFVLPSYEGGWVATLTAASRWKIAKTLSTESAAI